MREDLPVDRPTPLISKVIAVKPLMESLNAMPCIRPWHPPSFEYGCTNTITVPEVDAMVVMVVLSEFSWVGLKILALRVTPSEVVMTHDSIAFLVVIKRNQMEDTKSMYKWTEKE